MGTHPIFESDFDCLTDRRMATRGSLKYGGQVIGHNMVPAYQLYRFKPHRHRVLNLYKKAWRALESHDSDAQFYSPFWVDNSFCFERTVLRARFDENKHVTSLAKATELLKDGEEEFWLNQHQQPNDHGILVESQHGIAFKRFHNLQKADEETIKAGGRLSEDWPAAKKADGAPPFWWRYVARPLERPRRTEYDALMDRNRD